jgi:hypothetical protein
MIEFWLDIPDSVGRCPWTLEELVELLEPEGLRRMVFVDHEGSAVRLVEGAAEPAEEGYGNVIFMTDHVYERAHAAIELVAHQADRLSEAYAQMEVKEHNLRISAEAIETQRQAIEAIDADRRRLQARAGEPG